MADLTKGYTFGATEEVNATNLHALVDEGTATNIVADDITDNTITAAKIQSVSGAAFTLLGSIPSGAGVIPAANLTLTSVAQKGANSDITSLTGLTTPLSTSQGGTGTSSTFSHIGAYASNNQSITEATWTKINFNTEEFDTNSEFDNATNYRFTATKVGKYLVIVNISARGSQDRFVVVAVYKNGTLFKKAQYVNSRAAPNTDNVIGGISAVLSLSVNDYIEGYIYSETTCTLNGGQDTTFINISQLL